MHLKEGNACVCNVHQHRCIELLYGATTFYKTHQQDIPVLGFCAAGLSATGSSAIDLGCVADWEAPGAVVVPASVGWSWVERAEAGGALVLTGSSDVVRPVPATPDHREVIEHTQ